MRRILTLIVTDDGKTHEFEVTAVSDESIGGNDIDVPISNIAAIEVKEESAVKSAGLFAASFVLVLIGIAATAF